MVGGPNEFRVNLCSLKLKYYWFAFSTWNLKLFRLFINAEWTNAALTTSFDKRDWKKILQLIITFMRAKKFLNQI